MTGEAAPPQQQEQQKERAPSGLEQTSLTINSKGKVHRFTVELALTPEEQDRGLMHRTELAPDRGMLFPKAVAEPVAFWMKNTLIPLDMIFIRPDGTIARIADNRTPQSLEPVPSLEPVIATLELAGGRAAELGITAGDKVEWTQ